MITAMEDNPWAWPVLHGSQVLKKFDQLYITIVYS